MENEWEEYLISMVLSILYLRTGHISQWETGMRVAGGNMTSCCLDLTVALREPPYPENCYFIMLFCLYMLVRIS